MKGFLLSGLALAAAFSPASAAPAAQAATNLTYEYIVIGSGAGGGPLASRLARANHSVLLIESGNDQGTSYNYTVPGFQGLVTADKNIQWDFYVNHYPTLERAERDPKYVYQLSNGSQYIGLNPPAGAKPLGILYPRAGTLGGCVSHNALIWLIPFASDWDYIANITGDSSWSAQNMTYYLNKVYEWLHVEPTDPTILLRDPMLSQHLAGGAAVMGEGPDPVAAITGLAKTLAVDPNAEVPGRDSDQGFYQIPLIMNQGQRDGVRDFIVNTVNEGYPLTVRTNCFVTKILFNTSGSTPQATGVEFLDGEYLYRASPLSGGTGTPGTATATKEVIMAGGTYNTVQTLKLSGIGPAAELKNWSIPVIKNVPSLGTNMQDRYEIPVNVIHPNNFPILNGCTFDAKPHDLCYAQWVNNPYVLAQRGAYATDGLAATMGVHSNYASNSDLDLYIFGGPVDFTGYFPGWEQAAIADHQHFSWYTLKAHARNRAGTVTLRSSDPLDTPLINFNYFDTGTTAGGADVLDTLALVQAINMSRQALQRYYNYDILGGTSWVEQNPGPNVTSQADLETYIHDVAWGHHACCTAAIGNSQASTSVLNSNFQVIGVNGLRVVDASVFPLIPGSFIQSAIMMASEKAADVIINGS